MKKVDLSDFKVGDKAWSAMHGDVTVAEKNHQFIRVEAKKVFSTYYVNGNFCDSDTHPTLFHSQQEFLEYWGLQRDIDAPLTKREQFAIAAMQGILSNSKAPEFDYDHVTSAAVRFADYLVYNLENIDVETP
jgi:hypothetical protein